MRFLVSGCMVMTIAASPAAAVCQKGAVYNSQATGHTIVVKRVGFGKSRFTPGGPLQAGVALDIRTPDGERGALFGPMRSYMFLTDLKYLKRDGYRWQAAGADPNGFYRVLTDDGQSERFTLTFVSCAK